MGQALDRHGNVLGEAEGDTRSEVLEKLECAHADAAEIRIRERLRELEKQIGTCGDRPITVQDFRQAMAESPTPTWYPCSCGAEHDTPECPFAPAPPPQEPEENA